MDRKHFPDFYQKNVKRIYKFLLFRVSGNKEVAEDLTQDVFVKALAAFEKYDPKISESSWLYTIARNHLINSLEKQRPGVALEDIENTTWDHVDWESKLALDDDGRRLWKAINQLPKDDADLIRLKHIEGWSYDEIAEKTGKTTGSLRVQAHRATKELKKILKHK